jgi:hypothetical protein
MGDSMNVLLAAAAFNFRGMTNIYKKILAHIIEIIWASIFINYILVRLVKGRLRLF